jgi:glycosyltransferase involved in cell wall biosynthesis
MVAVGSIKAAKSTGSGGTRRWHSGTFTSVMTLPLTIIIPTFGRQTDVERALASVMSQKRLPELVIVVDDGSKEPINVQRFHNAVLPIKLIRHEENRGAAAARNTGMNAASTEWVSFLDSDDYLLEDSLEKRWQTLERALENGADSRTVFGCGWFDVDQNGRVLNLRWPQPGRSPSEFASGCWFSPGSCIILNRKLALEVGPQDETIRRFEDLEWFLRLSLAGFTYEPERIAGVAISRRRGASVQTDGTARLAARQVVEKWRGKLPGAVMNRLKAYMALEVGASAYFCGRHANAVFALAQSFAYAPRLRLQLSPGWHFGPVPQADGFLTPVVS